jgi:hypothetical protein
MAHILAHEPARELPLYIDGFHAGHDVGVMVALNALTRERVHQQQMADGARDQAPYVYADGALHAVAKVLGRRFWQ